MFCQTQSLFNETSSLLTTWRSSSSKSAAVYKISSKSNDFSPRYGDITIFTMAAVRLLEFKIFIFDHLTFIQFKICWWVQNFMKIGWFFTEIWRYINFQNGHPRSLCCWPQLPVKLHVNLIHRSEDHNVYLNFFAYMAWNAYSGPQNGGFVETLDP